MVGKYSTHILEFIRNNAMPQENCKNADKFMMLDYFDVLYCRELTGDEKTYMNYFSLTDIFKGTQQSKVSYKTLSLYQHTNEIKTVPFDIPKKKGEYLSDMPFLGIIQICLCKESYKSGTLLNGDVEGFLYKIEKEILQAAESVLSSEEREKVTMQIYRSSTTADFCMVMRTDAAEHVYKVASRLNNSRRNSKDGFKVLTYTNIGIECRRRKNIDDSRQFYCTFSPSFLEAHGDAVIAIRFSADSHVFKEMESCIKKEWLQKSLFGRYDYLLHITIRDFAEIYPELCLRKFWNPPDREVKTEGLGKFITDPRVRNINMRILIDCDDTPVEDFTNDDSMNYEEEKKKNDQLLDIINSLKNYSGDFTEENRAFHDLLRGMEELYKAFSSTAMEKDAVINWNIWYNDMKILCECIVKEMEVYKTLKSEREKKELRVNLLRSWRTNIQAINKYTRLVQNINYQTYQSPIYEMQTQIDTEKIMVAYREAMRIYVQEYAKNEESKKMKKGGDGIKITWIEPIIYPELLKDRVEVTVPFVNTAVEIPFNKKGIICTVPSFEYFGRMYDLLPWILHEASHYLRILCRKERNEFITTYIFKYVFKSVVSDILNKYAHSDKCVESGRAEEDLINSFIRTAQDEMESRTREYKKKYGREPGFEQIIYKTAEYLNTLFPYENDNRNSFESAKNSLQTFIFKQMRENGLLEISDKKSQEKLFSKLEKLKNSPKDVMLAEELEEFVGMLLEVYKGKVISCLKITKDKEESYPWIDSKDFSLPLKRLDNRIIKICLEVQKDYASSKAVLKEYSFAIKELYRFFWKYREIPAEKKSSQEQIMKFLEKVYYEYKRISGKRKENDYREYLDDPETMYILRNAGMMGDVNDFCRQIFKVFKKIRSEAIQDLKEFKATIYRETCADLLMAVSLNLSGFGYCRQVLQTVSDAKIERQGYEYDIINYSRFRIVAAVLMNLEDKAGFAEDEDEYKGDEYKIDGTKLIEQGKTYCAGTLRCIKDKLLECSAIRDNPDKREQALDFIGDIYEQVIFKLGNLKEAEYRSTFLYLILHGTQTENRIMDDIDKALLKKWGHYKDIVKECQGLKYMFLRLESFCRGLDVILTDGNIIVEKDIFEHMEKIYNNIKSGGKVKRGCRWENKMWDCMWKVKEDVGLFYNIPEKVYEKTSEQKLENTIEFIQNFYYHNRISFV